MTEEATGRVYGGRSQQERRQDRRARLLGAGFDLFGTAGWNCTTIEQLCAHAGVATRSFYEEFQNREALLLGVYLPLMAEVSDQVTHALARLDAGLDAQARAHAALVVYVRFMTSDPRRAQVAHREIRSVGSMEEHRQVVNGRFIEIILDQDDFQTVPPPLRRLLATALTGATNELFVDWVAHPSRRVPAEVLIETLARFYASVITSAQE